MNQQVNITKNVIIELTPAQLQVVIGLVRKGVYENVIGVLNSIETQVVKQMTAVEGTQELINGNGVPN